MLFKYDKDKNKLFKIEETTFSKERLYETQNIEKWIKRNPGILYGDKENEIKIIGEQKQSLAKKRLDLLAVDRFGEIVIIELKRDLAESMTEFQAITYASSYIYSIFDDICTIYSEYLIKNKEELNLSNIENIYELATNELKAFLEATVNIPDEFNSNQKIILVAGNFSKDLLSAATWLILKGIKIECIKLNLYKYENDLIIHPQMVLPTPDISENIIGIELSEKNVEQKRRKYQKWIVDPEWHYRRLQAPLGDYLRQFIEELSEFGIEPENLSGTGFHLINGERKILITNYKSKLEFRFSGAYKKEIIDLLNELGIASFKVKDKADIEPYGLENSTPSIDYYKEDIGKFEDIKRICKKWLEIDKR